MILGIQNLKASWRKWFAWYPVPVYHGDGTRTWVWWEHVERHPAETPPGAYAQEYVYRKLS